MLHSGVDSHFLHFFIYFTCRKNTKAPLTCKGALVSNLVRYNAYWTAFGNSGAVVIDAWFGAGPAALTGLASGLRISIRP